MSSNILLRKTSFIDFPGQISSVFFFCGCNLGCPWCHNRDLITGGTKGLVSLREALAHAGKRRSVLKGVVLSGGEPCLQKDLPDIIREIKKLPLAVKLDTNGMFPAVLEELLDREETRPDYVALDLKIAPSRYGELARYDENEKHTLGDKLVKSAELIRGSGVRHEYRTLALPAGYITRQDIDDLAPLADNAPWYFRPFRSGNCLEPSWDRLEESKTEAHARSEALAARARELGKNGIISIIA